MRRPIGIVFALSLSAPLSASALALLTQDRSVHADAYLAPSFGTPIVVSETKVSPHFGPFDETANAAAGFAGIAVVPEPATGLLAMLGMLGLAGRRLRARHLLRLAGHWRKS